MAKQKIDLAAMSIPELKELHKRLLAHIRERTAEKTRSTLEDKLDPIEPDPKLVPAKDRRRFEGGFFVETDRHGKISRFFAKTKSGLLYRYDAMTKKWVKMPY